MSNVIKLKFAETVQNSKLKINSINTSKILINISFMKIQIIIVTKTEL